MGSELQQPSRSGPPDNGSTSSISQLLDQLSTSTAWQQAIALNVNTTSETSAGLEPSKPESSDAAGENAEDASGPSDRVSALLSLLGPNKGGEVQTSTPSTRSTHVPDGTLSGGDSRVDRGNLVSFGEALQIVTRLVERKPGILDHLREIREEQNRLERTFWANRDRIIESQKAQVKELKTKVAMTGPLGPREVEKQKAQFEGELRTLEVDEFLPAWDRLRRRQQSTLQRMGIPYMHETEDEEEQKKQKRLISVLEGWLDSAPRP
ncbi:hypothetical protein PIIN_05174 [Serendipita indica DSM 11827]|uniref:Uncharacterized protein n=1 Tax=Serendipita indica (strain DSM 11827) TaxID=1109443 RepID=G4TIU1_SERID|nr:hypothetical protein PIIN_05174 [Serendipita indica DSM 11827]